MRKKIRIFFIIFEIVFLSLTRLIECFVFPEKYFPVFLFSFSSVGSIKVKCFITLYQFIIETFSIVDKQHAEKKKTTINGLCLCPPFSTNHLTPPDEAHQSRSSHTRQY